MARVAIDALAASMLVTILLDAWRLVAMGSSGLPWLMQPSNTTAL